MAKNTARKKPRSAAQKAATARMVAAMKAKRKGNSSTKPRRNKRAGEASRPQEKTPRAKKPRSAAQKAATAKMLAANSSTKQPPRAPRARPKARASATSTIDRKGF
jgi:hypothetical protein